MAATSNLPWARPASAFQVLAVLVAVATVAVFLGLKGLFVLAATERWVADLQLALFAPAEPPHPDILVVAITEETLEPFPYRSPIDRGFLADLLEDLQSRGVRAILLDVLFDQPTETDKDARLKETLQSLPMPLAVAYARAEEGLTPSQSAFLDAFVPVALRGFAVLIRQDASESTVRTAYSGRALPDGTVVPGLTGRVVERLGGTIPPDSPFPPIAWRGQPDPATPAFRSIPADLVTALPPAVFAGKIVLIGADLSLTDRHRTPFAAVRRGNAGMLPGVEIHAHALAQCLEGRPPAEAGPVQQIAAIALAALAGVLIVMGGLPLVPRLAALAAAVVVLWAGGIGVYHLGGPLLPLFTPTLAFGLAAWMADVHLGRQERHQRRFVQMAFSRYVSADLLEELIRDPARLTLEATRKDASLIFTDVADFTTLSEQLDPATLADVLNRYLDALCTVIFRFGGTINQFTGDAIYAMFNAPKTQEDHPRRALACAVELDRVARAFVEAERIRGIPFGHTRIGVHTAVVNVGNFGSLERFEYKALGDAVNTCSRLEGLNKYFNTRLCVSAGTARHCPDQPFRPIGLIVLKGKSEAIEVLEPLGAEADASDHIAAYRRAYASLAAAEPEALSLFRALHAAAPEDGCVAFHLARLEAGETGVLVRMGGK